ncbi:hypothetical protein CLV98_1345, partial [Dyadobacter jejuensis]
MQQTSTIWRKANKWPFMVLLFFLCLGLKPVAQAQVRIDMARILGSQIASDNYGILYSKVIQGKTYIVGQINGYRAIPVTNGITYKGGAEIVIGVMDENGDTQLLTLFGGSDEDYPNGLEVANGKIYVSFTSQSQDLPVTNGSTNGSGDYQSGFVIMDEHTGAIEFATYIGGENGDSGYDNITSSIRLIGNEILVAGYTEASDFYTTDGTSHKGSRDLFVRRYSSTGALLYSTLIGGANIDYGPIYDYATGIIYLTTTTRSSDYPVTDESVYNPSVANAATSVVTALNANTGAILWSKNISSVNLFGRVYADASGVFLIGKTSVASAVPITTGSSHGGGNDVVVMKFSPSGFMQFARYIGGSGNEEMYGAELYNGELYVTGRSASPNYPVVNGLPYVGGYDVFLTKIDAGGQIAYSTLIGGTGNEGYPSMGMANGEVYLGFECTVNTPSTDGSSYNNSYPPSYAITKFEGDGQLCFSSIQDDGYTGLYTAQDNYRKLYVEGNFIYFQSYFHENNVTEAPFAGGNYNPGVVKYKICPTLPAPVSDPLSPASQTVCANGLVQQLIGGEMVIPGGNFPQMFNYVGVPFNQAPLNLDYQWQVADTPSGPWTNLVGATDKNYSPFPTTVSKYFRRLTMGGACCGGELYSTSEVAAVLVGANAAPTVDAGGGVTGIMQTCSGVSQNLGGSPTATGGSSPYAYLWSTGATSANPSVSSTENAIYTLTVTDANGCQQSDQVILNTYKADAGPDKGNCAGAGV